MIASDSTLPAFLRIKSAACRRVSRLRERLVCCATAGHGGLNSGRNVKTVRMRSCSLSARNCARNSRVDASTQCKSSTINSNGSRGTCLQELDQGGEDFFPLSRGRKCEGRVSVGRRQRKERGPKRHRFLPSQIISAQTLDEPLEPCFARVVAVEFERPFEVVDGRVESRVLKMRRAAPLDDGRVFFGLRAAAGDVLLEVIDKSRFAKSRLADQEHDLSHTLLGLLPTVGQQAHLMVAAGERREAACRRRFDQAAGRGDPLEAKQADRLGHPFDFLSSQINATKAAAEESLRFLGADDVAGHGDACQAQGHVALRQPA